MTEQLKKKPGRPLNKPAPELQGLTERELPIMSQTLIDEAPKKVGTFIVINTPTIKGVRLNLEKIRAYAKTGENNNVIRFDWDNGTSSQYAFGTEADTYAFLETLDTYCL